MSEFTIEELLKIILGALVVIAVGVGVSLFFKNSVIDFFKNLAGGNNTKVFLSLL